MNKNLHLVFSTPPAGVSDEVYNAWYDQHLYDILAIPGFEAARRYELTTMVGRRNPAGKRFLSMYEVSADVDQIERELAGDRSAVQFPEWFPGIEFASWNCVLRPGYEPPVAADQMYFVFSSAPDGVTDHDYDEFYIRHMKENISVPGFGRAWRFRTKGANVPDETAEPITHLGLYELPGTTIDALRPGLTAAKESGSVYFPTWFDQIDFASVEGRALGERVVAPEH